MTYVVGRRRGIYDLHITVLMLPLDLLRRGVHIRMIITKLQEPLETSARVLGALPVVAMGQRHNQARALQPLPLARSPACFGNLWSDTFVATAGVSTGFKRLFGCEYQQ